jgi:hypothetical protein
MFRGRDAEHWWRNDVHVPDEAGSARSLIFEFRPIGVWVSSTEIVNVVDLLGFDFLETPGFNEKRRDSIVGKDARGNFYEDMTGGQIAKNTT